MVSMKKYILIVSISVLAANLNAAAKTAESCFSSPTQKFTYEKSLSSSSENEEINKCLKEVLISGSDAAIRQALPLLQKSGNMAEALSETVNIFIKSKDAPTAFSAAAALISTPESISRYQKKILGVISAQTQEDYKKTLAVIILASAGKIDSKYTSFLTPALNAEDAVLKVYASSAYALLIPETKTRFLQEIIGVYGFDKNLALKALESTGLKQKELYAALRTALRNKEEIIRASAAQWIGDSADKKLLENLFLIQTHDTPTISAAANALASNYDLVADKLKKELKAEPKSPQADIVVMTYALLGGEHLADIEKGLESNNENEQANSARVVRSIAEILQNKRPFYTNSALEEQRIKKLIPPLGKLANRSKNKTVKYYSDAASKAIYALINK